MLLENSLKSLSTGSPFLSLFKGWWHGKAKTAVNNGNGLAQSRSYSVQLHKLTDALV
jgi:hypothetical protein